MQQRTKMVIPDAMKALVAAAMNSSMPPQQLTGQVTVGLDLPNGTADVIYRTTDGGKTWTWSK